MEIQELKELALMFKEIVNCKRKTTLDIFYNVENCAELLSTDTLSWYTPTYTAKTEPALSFRGSIEKSEVNKLKVGLRNVSNKDIDGHAKWTFSVYNRNTEQYQLISQSSMNIKSFINVSNVPIQFHDIQHLIHENALLFKWNIETSPLSPGQAKVRSPDVINALDELLEHLSVVEDNENENQKTLLVILKCLGECKNRQQNNDHKLQAIEQNVFDINHRLTAMLSNVNTTRERFLQELEFQSHYSAQAIPTDQIELGNEMIMTLEEKKGTCEDRSHRLDSNVPLQHSTYRSVRSGLNDQTDLLLIGKTGNGKSALGNSILDYNAFVSEPSSTSVTKEVSDEVNDVNGRIIRVVDTPGVGDTDWGRDEATVSVVNALSQAIAINPEGYHAILLVVRFGGRFTKEDQGTVDFLKKVFGQNFVRKFCILVLTYGDQFQAQVKVSFQDWIQSQKGVLSDLVKECNNRVILFDNQTTDKHKKQRQVNKLIEIVDSLKNENSRYSNDQFDLARTERESLELASKAPLIIDTATTEADVIFKQFKGIQETFIVNYDHLEQVSKLEQLFDRSKALYDSIWQKDNKTGVLGDMLRHLERLNSLIDSEIQLCKRMPEVEKQISKKYDNQLEESTQKLKDAMLNFDHLSQERKKTELHKIQELKEENRRLKKEKEELEMNQFYNSLEFKLLVKTCSEIDEQYTKVKEKHRKNVLSSMYHKIAKTFSKKTKDIELPVY